MRFWLLRAAQSKRKSKTFALAHSQIGNSHLSVLRLHGIVTVTKPDNPLELLITFKRFPQFWVTWVPADLKRASW